MENLIKIHLKEKKDYINKYNNDILSYELKNYILEELKGIETKKSIKFSITLDFKIEQFEKNNLVDMIRNSFGAEISEIIVISKKQITSNIILLITGIILVTIYTILKLKILAQFTLIFGWILLGEAICNFMYKSIINKHQISRRKQIVNAKIIFEEKK